MAELKKSEKELYGEKYNLFLQNNSLPEPKIYVNIYG